MVLAVAAVSLAPSSTGSPSGEAAASGHQHGAPVPSPAQNKSAPARADASPAPAPAPSRSTAISTPSWFPGGDSLYVPGFYDSFQGLDLTALSASQKERFLHEVNTEFCTCNQTGCRRDTIAHCYLTDAACPRAPVRIRELLEQAKAPEKTGDTAPSPSVTVTPRP